MGRPHKLGGAAIEILCNSVCYSLRGPCERDAAANGDTTTTKTSELGGIPIASQPLSKRITSMQFAASVLASLGRRARPLLGWRSMQSLVAPSPHRG
jgi:hypothetical protein